MNKPADVSATERVPLWLNGRREQAASTRSGVRWLSGASWSLVKQTTSQRPAPGRVGVYGVSSPGGSPARSLSDGNRFSKTATS